MTNFCLLSDFFPECFPFVQWFPSQPLFSTLVYIIEKQFLRKILPRFEWTLIWGTLSLCELPSVVRFCFLVVMAKFCLFGGFFFDCFFSFNGLVLTIFVKFNFHHRKRFSRKVLARIEWNLIWEMLTLCEVRSVVGFCSVVIMVTVCLLNCFFLVFFSLIFSFLATIVNSNLQHRTKDTEKKLNLELNWGLRIQSTRC